ncbi:12521_t:CDS:2 [Entrophospora sp. SA101]|nr:9375_t:CDS:2 [Entrophospora candida]CAH1755966.1 11189_t:CDS:2 [Entrophospora sp. SA101]CAG8469865.1 10579_t:CDS:2 [Entrophospora candida]CAJ0626608.1 12502_t:CDS:2 [Entrophospora sp. SA101]CAJ0626632.1 12521_t:CDS:2 [Entrophospora sp. SA101]
MSTNKVFVIKGIQLVFYVKHEVPEKSTVERLIKDNGGKVVSRPNDARWILADPSKPQNRTQRFKILSYKIIIDSIKKNKFQSISIYQIVCTAKRTGRTEFTFQDDKFIENFLQTKSHDFHGKVIYEELEHLNDRHSWESWRKRAIEKVIPRLQKKGTL